MTQPLSSQSGWSLDAPVDTFVQRHIGPAEADIQEMVATLGLPSLEAVAETVVPPEIRLRKPLALGHGRGEHEVLAALRTLHDRNQVFRSYIGMGFHDCITPPVIQRNILENPGWYTQYTPYQAEIAQGRLEALLNFQTMVADLTGLPLANASLLDEASAAAEALHMCLALNRARHDIDRRTFFVADDCHPQTIAVLQTRAEPLGVRLQIGKAETAPLHSADLLGVLLQNPTTDGLLYDYSALIQQAHAAGALAVMATDLLALTLLRPPGEYDADIAIGSTQRFGVPLGFGGPHAAFLASRQEFVRQLPGRLVGVSKDAAGQTALRLALQTREQHIRRDKATSNICTAQVLLAVLSSMYAVYHGPEGLKRIAQRLHGLALVLAQGLRRLGYTVHEGQVFDTVKVQIDRRAAGHTVDRILARAKERRMNFRRYDDGAVGIALDEMATTVELQSMFEIFAAGKPVPFAVADLVREISPAYPAHLTRTGKFLTQDVFNRYHSEHEMLRYIHRLQARDLSLTHSMIPLGSCTMKLNGTVEMIPVTWKGFSRLHPFAPVEQWLGYQELFRQLEDWLAEITGFAAVSLQPNAGSQGEYAGLMVIRAYHRNQGQARRDVCLIPVSAHGTNPASAVLPATSRATSMWRTCRRRPRRIETTWALS
jgi:glycine dehydrogenase